MSLRYHWVLWRSGCRFGRAKMIFARLNVWFFHLLRCS